MLIFCDRLKHIFVAERFSIFNFEHFIAGPEYGTTEAAWKAVLVEADRRCELHIKVKDNLLNEVFFRDISGLSAKPPFWPSGCEQYKELAEGQLPQADDAAEGEEGDGGPVQEGPEAVGQALGEGGQVQGERDLDILPVLTILLAEQLSHGLQERKDCC